MSSEETGPDPAAYLDELDETAEEYSLEEFRELVGDETAYCHLANYGVLADEEQVDTALEQFYEREIEFEGSEEVWWYHEIYRFLDGKTLADAWEEGGRVRQAARTHIANIYNGVHL